MVRAAVLKGKDPQQILEEMEKIDQMGKSIDFSALNSVLHTHIFFLQNLM